MTGPLPSQDEVDKIDLAPFGYAKGNTPIHCYDCPPGEVHFLHPHAWRCAGHALEARQSLTRAEEGRLVTDPDQEFEEAVYGLMRAASDRFIRRAFIASIVLAPIVVAAIILI